MRLDVRLSLGWGPRGRPFRWRRDAWALCCMRCGGGCVLASFCESRGSVLCGPETVASAMRESSGECVGGTIFGVGGRIPTLRSCNPASLLRALYVTRRGSAPALTKFFEGDSVLRCRGGEPMEFECHPRLRQNSTLAHRCRQTPQTRRAARALSPRRAQNRRRKLGQTALALEGPQPPASLPDARGDYCATISASLLGRARTHRRASRRAAAFGAADSAGLMRGWIAGGRAIMRVALLKYYFPSIEIRLAASNAHRCHML